MGSALFACMACGKKFRWKPEIAGKAGRCGCGSRLVAPSAPESGEIVEAVAAVEAAQRVDLRPVKAMPAMQPGVTRPHDARVASLTAAHEADEGLYDVAEDSRPPAPAAASAPAVNLPASPRANSAMAFPAKPAFKPVIEEEATPVVPNTMPENIVCIALIALGVALTLFVVMRYGKEPVPLDRAIVQAGIQIIVNLGLMIVAIFVATYTIEDAFLDPWWRIALKTCAIGLCPDAIGQIIGAQIGDINGDIAKVFITVFLYLGLFLALFRINILHTAGCVLVIWVIRTTVDYSLYKLEGLRSDSWI